MEGCNKGLEPGAAPNWQTTVAQEETSCKASHFRHRSLIKSSSKWSRFCNCATPVVSPSARLSVTTQSQQHPCCSPGCSPVIQPAVQTNHEITCLTRIFLSKQHFGPQSTDRNLIHSLRNLQLRTNNAIYARAPERPSSEDPKKMTSRFAIPTFSPESQYASTELLCSLFPDAGTESQRNNDWFSVGLHGFSTWKWTLQIFIMKGQFEKFFCLMPEHWFLSSFAPVLLASAFIYISKPGHMDWSEVFLFFLIMSDSSWLHLHLGI